MEGGRFTDFIFNPVLELFYNLCASRGVPKPGHLVVFRDAYIDIKSPCRGMRESKGAAEAFRFI